MCTLKDLNQVEGRIESKRLELQKIKDEVENLENRLKEGNMSYISAFIRTHVYLKQVSTVIDELDNLKKEYNQKRECYCILRN